MTAAFSRRLDHTLAAFGLLARTADLAGEAREPGLTAWALDGASRPSLVLPLEAGAVVSLAAVLGTAAGVTLEGMRFPLHDAELAPLAGLGVSNVVEVPPARVSLLSGSLLVLAPHADGA